MNIRSTLTALALLCLCFTGYSQSKLKMTPLEYNDYLSSITDSLYSKGMRWGTKFSAIRKDDQDFTRLKPLRKDISNFIILKREEVSKKAAIGKGGEYLKQAILNFMDYESDMVETAFMPLENLTAASTDKEIDDAIQRLVNESGREGDLLNMVRTAQKVFAEDNGFTLEEPEE